MQSFLHPVPNNVRAILAVLLIACRLAVCQGTPVSARTVPLLLPSAIAYDSAGNLFIAELSNHTVRKVDTQGNITAFAGDGTQGFGGDGGPATQAHLDSPHGVAVDGAGNVYVSDSNNHRIRRIDAVTGTMQTIAGTGAPGFAGDSGPAAAALLNQPRGLALSANATALYVADTRNHRIRRIDLQTKIIVTVAGNGDQGSGGDAALATSANLDSPDSVAVDTGDNLYIADTHNHRVRRVAASTGIITGVQGTAATLPRGLILDRGGNLYIADAGGNRIVRVDAVSGTASVIAGTAIQGYSGDGGPAATADLNSPEALALSPTGLASIADTANQRVRQLTADTSPAPSIRTVAGLGLAVPGTLSLTSPAVVAYGGGSASVALSTGPSASGQVTFLDVGEGSTSVVGTGVLSGGAASVSLAYLAAGQHRLMATYAGDGSNPAAQSAVSLVTVSPLPITITLLASTVTYGSPLPTLTGSIAGLLPQDASLVSATFSTAAMLGSPAGSYPIAVSLAGPSASNYQLSPAHALLTITQAPSLTTLSSLTGDEGFTGSLKAAVASTTSGSPSGIVTILDNGSPLLNTSVTALGAAIFSGITLAAGTHALTASYSGDANFLPSSSPVFTELVAAPPSTTGDFTIASTAPSSQTLVSGNTVSYTFNVNMLGGGLSSPIVFAVAGQPQFATTSFNPSYLPPGGAAATTVALTVTLPNAAAMQDPRSPWRLPSAVMALSAPFFLCLVRGRATSRKDGALPRLLLEAVCVTLSSLAVGCGDRTNSSGQTAATLKSFTLTISGTGTDSKGATVQHMATVVLKMPQVQ